MRREDYAATLVLMLGLAAAALTGYLREAALAHQLGAGRAADIYLIAFTIPEFFFVALPSILSPAFIPLFVELHLRAGEGPAWRFAEWVGGVLLVLLLGSAVLAVWSAPLYLPGLAPGFGVVDRLHAAQALRRMSPAIALMGEAVLAGALLQVYRRFGRPALATAAYNLAFVAVLLFGPWLWPLARAAWAVTAGAVVALAIQLPLLWRCRPPSRPVDRQDLARLRPSHYVRTSFAQLTVVAAPLTASYAVHHAILVVDRAMATLLGAGSVAALNYAYHLALVVGQLSGLAVSTAVFPRMAEQAAAQDLPGLRASLAAALRFVWLVGLPACGGLILFRVPLVQLLFEHGAFEPASTTAVSQLLIWYAPAALADALCQPLWRVLYAWRQGWTILAVNGLQTALRILGNVALVPPFGYNGLAISALLGLSVQAFLLAWLVRRRLGEVMA